MGPCGLQQSFWIWLIEHRKLPQSTKCLLPCRGFVVCIFADLMNEIDLSNGGLGRLHFILDFLDEHF
jgi:hypothetical protein